VQTSSLRPYNPRGLDPYPEEVGALDFLRDLASEEFALPRFYEVRVLGLEEVLFAAGDDLPELAAGIRRLLQSAASDLERRLVKVQVVFTGRLVRGDTLWCEYRQQRLPIELVFGSPIAQEDGRGNRLYLVSFNLTDV
jgi:hypothetical protein